MALHMGVVPEANAVIGVRVREKVYCGMPLPRWMLRLLLRLRCLLGFSSNGSSRCFLSNRS